MTLDLDNLDRLATAAKWTDETANENAAYMAALSPDVTRALIARLRAAERVVKAATVVCLTSQPTRRGFMPTRADHVSDLMAALREYAEAAG